jgi:hypothetical protein
MGALAIAPDVLAQIDKKTTVFPVVRLCEKHWCKSLIAWDHVYDTKDRGGLGLKDLSIHNTCLLLKLIHKLHSNNVSSWANWVQNKA